MSWSRFDDGYDEHERIEDAWFAFPPNPVGLHIMATTACNRWQSDGVIRPRWLTARLPDPDARGQVLAYMVANALFDFIPSGSVAIVLDADGAQHTLGPFDGDRYVVHDFLQRHDSSERTKARRAADAERKRRERRADSDSRPVPVQPDGASDSAKSPLTGAGAGALPHPYPTQPYPTEEESVGVAREQIAATVEVVTAILAQCPRLRLERVGIENAITAWPTCDPTRAAREVVAWASDPAVRKTNGASLLNDFLSKQQDREAKSATVVTFPRRTGGGPANSLASDLEELARIAAEGSDT